MRISARTWFAPMPYAPPGRTDAIDGSVDFDELFASPHRWPVAAAVVDVVKLYSGWVEWHATDAQLRSIVAATRVRGQALGLEIGSLVGTDACGLDIEGFNATLAPIRRIHAMGGTVAFLAFDEPLAFGHFYRGERACGWSVEQVAEATARFVQAVRTIEPDIAVGDIEPLWDELSPAALGAWLDAYRTAAGRDFDFMHLDVDWSVAGWRQWVAATAAEVRARGIELGVIYIGGLEDSDIAWTDAARANIDGVEEALNGRPDEIVFQSWFHFPRRALPETDLSTFTGLVRQYAVAERTTVAISGATGGTLTGHLLSSDGTPLSGAQLAVAAVPLDGGYAELHVGGTVPAGARTALVGLRVNTEGGGARATQLSVYRFSYREADGKNLVPDPEFTRGSRVWGVAGDATVRFTASDRGSGRMLEVAATDGQTLVLNGGEFGVSPGERFDLDVWLDVPAAGPDAPLAVLIFLAGTEVSRTSLTIQPQWRAIADVKTDGSGAFSVALPPVSGRLSVELRYAGDLDHWRMVRTLEVPSG